MTPLFSENLIISWITKMNDPRTNLPIEKKFSNTISPIIEEVFKDFDQKGWPRPTLILIGSQLVEPLEKEGVMSKITKNADYVVIADGALFGTYVMCNINVRIDPNDILILNSIGQTQIITVHN